MAYKKEKSELIRDYLAKKRVHRKKWPEPQAKAIFNLHFEVHSHAKGVFHAEATLEIPVSESLTEFYTISSTAWTKAGALRAVIERIETSNWFQHFLKRGVRFRVTGAGMERIYRGYL